MAPGKRGRPLTDLERRHLELLLGIRREWYEYARLYDHRLENFVVEMLDSGASVRGLAEQIRVSTRTIQDWAAKARERQATEGHDPY